MVDLDATALVVVDVQTGVDGPQWGPRNDPECASLHGEFATVVATRDVLAR